MAEAATSVSPRVLLIAEEGAGVQALQTATDAGCSVTVVTTERTHAGICTPIATVARARGCEIWSSQLLAEDTFADRVRAGAFDILLNVHSLVRIRPDVIASVKIGAFNLHPGPLPQYAGLNAPSWAIFNRETRYGVTLHWMVESVDAGAIAYQTSFDLTGRETALSLSVACLQTGMPLIRRLLHALRTDPLTIPRTAQELSRRRYFRRRDVPHGGMLPWHAGAKEIEALVRAADYGPFSSPWGHPVTRVGERDAGIARASLTGRRCDLEPGTVGTLDDAGAHVATGDEWIVVRRLFLGAKYVAPSEVLHAGMSLRS